MNCVFFADSNLFWIFFSSQIVNISAYAGPDSQYSQHIMPLNNLNPGARQRHQIRVINVGCFRMLKSMQTYKVRNIVEHPKWGATTCANLTQLLIFSSSFSSTRRSSRQRRKLQLSWSSLIGLMPSTRRMESFSCITTNRSSRRTWSSRP